MTMQPVAARFWPKVAIAGPRECWHWTAARQRQGYGVFKFDGHVAPAHRVSWILANWQHPARTMDVMHLCGVKSCVNPAHLRLGTRSENMRMFAREGV